MYGLYLEIVQAIPSGGSALIKKAYSSINNKWHSWRDVIDIAVGSSAVIVASVEPDKIGKIIDTSSSVKELFKTSKQGLIGTNIGRVLPNFVAIKHNDLIRGYQKYFTRNIDHSISSYAKTLQDEYFKVQVTLHVSPLTHQGINLVSYIKKISGYQPLMIVDPTGNIVEYSKDLSVPLNLKKSSIKIETLCPDFKKINQAFSVLYKNTTNEDVLKNTCHLDNILPPMSSTNQRLLSNSTEVPLSSANDETPRIVHPNISGNNDIPMPSPDEAQEIWEEYKDNKELTFYPFQGLKRKQQIKYSAEIEPFFFDDKWYKIVKLKSPKVPVPHDRTSPQPIVNLIDEFANDFPNIDERTEAEVMTVKTKNQTLSFGKKSNSQIFKEEGNSSHQGPVDNMKKFSNKAQSVVSSQASQNMTAKRLNDSFKIERQNTRSKLVITLLYFSVIAIVCSVFVHLVYAKSSLHEMESSMNLIRLVNTRLSKTILNWQGMMILYSRSVGLRPLDFKVPMYKAITINSSLAILENAKELTEEADKFANKDLVSSLYAKTVSLWEPLSHTLFDNHVLGQFTANQVLIDYYLWVARSNRSILDLAGTRKFLFAINNTANDYLLTLDRSVHDLAGFFDDTKDKNIRLITVITVMEILLAFSPLALILIIFFIIIKTYSKLFQAISRINENSLAKRVQQLQDISTLFEESLEDDVSFFHKFKNQGLAIKRSAPTTSSRRFQIQGLVMHLSKYILLAAFLTVIVVILVVFALAKTVQNFKNLETINQRVLTVYNVGAQIRMLQPTFQISIIFSNDTSYKIRNGSPRIQLLDQLEVLNDANNILLSVLTDFNNEISDPVVKDILDGNVCQYVTTAYRKDCIQNTKGSAYGLLGLNSLYSLVCQAMKNWADTINKTFSVGVTLAAQYSILNTNVHLNLFDIYDYLSDYLVGTFTKATEENKAEIQNIFYRNLTAVLVAMFLIRVIVITKLQVFDLGVRRILRLIPYVIIEENKVMSYYLARTFKDELKVFKQID